ncbi:DNA-directed RNA polymerase III subunit RPC7-like protein [Lates japonicus]|uniref:DNA-directed RNA polymerase III subunit RPC7-like protein n=1 Tax=Lates japonicus TaxID=270547 RepID=A0AAD3NBX6_LATJO|nr:DNA-directed RNA polymerase III subunit RPC7-like protein [Lates japonicus]
MAGRGRGRRTMSFSVDAVGINRGDSLPPSMQQPTPLFPVMEQKPLPLAGGEEAEYLLALKQEFRGAMRSLPCFIQPAAAHRDVERYSDKYHSSEQTDSLLDWTPDWKRFPRELRVHVRKPHRDGVSVSVSRSDKVQSGQRKKRVKEKEEVLLKLEETDYIMSYFDNGEDFGGDSDDNMDEAIY